MAGVLTAGTITAATNPVAAGQFLIRAAPAAMVVDACKGEPSFSVSITGHHGDTFGHLDFPH
ncbi:MAG: hypothetical protein LF885_04070 [Rickettsia endosymbiont of Culicoides impunctatus]|uniref:hypothetical protein n=1 Tax=unclassified Candidatus Tisiphia TaxID=2996318 RepID=UPI001E725622|nr:hypothetical protein [Rickettsia endosymbiont of Platyusa sonomae]UCM85188.1 MAG: hypothetical protein LF885_04070 [Rickettsia endosymbiont of Culicoides impunctatus]